MSYSKRHLGLSLKQKRKLIKYKKASYILALLNEAQEKDANVDNDELISRIKAPLIACLIKVHQLGNYKNQDIRKYRKNRTIEKASFTENECWKRLRILKNDLHDLQIALDDFFQSSISYSI
jgi:hypothetical protein